MLPCPACSVPSDFFPCPNCGHDLAAAPALRDVSVARCPHFGEQLRYDPATEKMSSVFICWLGCESCVACPVCTKCGQLRCICGLVGIKISVGTGTVIETVASRKVVA